MRSPLVAVAVAVVAGILVDRQCSPPAALWWSLSLVLLFLWLAAARNAAGQAREFVLLAAVACAMAAWHHARWNHFAADDLSNFADERPRPAGVEAEVLRGPEHLAAAPFDPLCAMPRGERTRFLVRAVAIRDHAAWTNASGHASLVVDGRVEHLWPGDRVRIFAELSRWTPPANPGEYDFAAHFRADRILCRMTARSAASVVIVERAAWWWPPRWLEAVRRHCQAALAARVNPRVAPLAAALVLGTDGAVDRHTIEAFFHTGTIHLLSISGLHVGVLAFALLRSPRLGWLPARLAYPAIAAIVAAYALVIAAEPPAMRATIFILVVCLALALDRRVSMPSALAAAAILVLAMNPAELFRTGPQLSFLAAAALAWLSPRLGAWPRREQLDILIERSRPWAWRVSADVARRFARGTLLAAGIWLVTLPLVASRFHVLPPASIVLTPLLAWPVAIAIMSAFIVMTFDWLPPVAWFAGKLCGASLMLVEWAITGLDGAIPTHWWWAGPGAATVALVYLLALALVWWRERVEPIAVFTTRRWRWAAMASLAAVGFAFAWPATTPAPALRCTFLSVGHGGATLIELPDGRALLYDAGHMGLPESAAASVSACLWSRGIRRLEAVVVSHADIDHFNAVPELLRRFDIGRVIVPPSVLANTSLAVRELFRSAAAAKVNVATALAGDELPIAGGARGENYSLRVLHPAGDQKLSSDNAESLVLSIEHAGRRALLTGDIDGDGLATLLKTPAIDCDVVAAPHHGSRHSNPLRFARWTTPEWVVVCDGPSAELGPLEAAYGALGGEVLHTARDGAITFDITADAIAVSLFRAPHERHEWATRLW